MVGVSYASSTSGNMLAELKSTGLRWSKWVWEEGRLSGLFFFSCLRHSASPQTKAQFEKEAERSVRRKEPTRKEVHRFWVKTLTRGKKNPDKNKQAVPNFYYRAEYISQQCASFCFLLIQPVVSYIPPKKSWMVIQQQKVTSLECGCSRTRCEPIAWGLLITAVY